MLIPACVANTVPQSENILMPVGAHRKKIREYDYISIDGTVSILHYMHTLDSAVTKSVWGN